MLKWKNAVLNAARMRLEAARNCGKKMRFQVHGVENSKKTWYNFIGRLNWLETNLA